MSLPTVVATPLERLFQASPAAFAVLHAALQVTDACCSHLRLVPLTLHSQSLPKLHRLTLLLQWNPVKRASAAQLLQMPFFKGERRLPSPLPIPIEKSVFRAPKHTPAPAGHVPVMASASGQAAYESADASAFAAAPAADQQPQLAKPMVPRAGLQSQRRPMMLLRETDYEPSPLQGSSSIGSSSTGGSGDLGRGGGSFTAPYTTTAPATARFPDDRATAPPPSSSSAAVDLLPTETRPKFGRRAAQ
jgi:hypothetical protein